MSLGLLKDSCDKKNSNETDELTVKLRGLSALAGQPAVKFTDDRVSARGTERYKANVPC